VRQQLPNRRRSELDIAKAAQPNAKVYNPMFADWAQ
jgi:hypothetical protein